MFLITLSGCDYLQILELLGVTVQFNIHVRKYSRGACKMTINVCSTYKFFYLQKLISFMSATKFLKKLFFRLPSFLTNDYVASNIS